MKRKKNEEEEAEGVLRGQKIKKEKMKEKF